jgi:hypothetical protein
MFICLQELVLDSKIGCEERVVVRFFVLCSYRQKLTKRRCTLTSGTLEPVCVRQIPLAHLSTTVPRRYY